MCQAAHADEQGVRVQERGRYVRWWQGRLGLHSSGWWCRTCDMPVLMPDIHEKVRHGVSPWHKDARGGTSTS